MIDKYIPLFFHPKMATFVDSLSPGALKPIQLT